MGNTKTISARKPEMVRLHVKPWHRWKNKIKMDFKETVLKGAQWVQLLPLGSRVMNLGIL
jgi:hypothetical protein